MTPDPNLLLPLRPLVRSSDPEGLSSSDSVPTAPGAPSVSATTPRVEAPPGLGPDRSNLHPNAETRPRYHPAPSEHAVRNFGATLRPRHRGPAVATLQDLLNEVGSRPPLRVDGLFGPRTRQAVETFQAQQGLPVTGRVDPETWTRLVSGETREPVIPLDIQVELPTELGSTREGRERLADLLLETGLDPMNAAGLAHSDAVEVRSIPDGRLLSLRGSFHPDTGFETRD